MVKTSLPHHGSSKFLFGRCPAKPRKWGGAPTIMNNMSYRCEEAHVPSKLVNNPPKHDGKLRLFICYVRQRFPQFYYLQYPLRHWFTHSSASIDSWKYAGGNFLCSFKWLPYPLHIGCNGSLYIQDVELAKGNIIRGHSICHSKKKIVYVHVSYSERCPR
jgi:hypothetical protein